MKKIFLLLALGLCFALPACGTLQSAKDAAIKVEQSSLPRARVAVLAVILKDAKEGLAAEFTAGKLSKIDLLATEAPVGRASAALYASGQLLTDSANDTQLAASTTDTVKQLQYRAQAVAQEAMAVRKSDEAEVDIMPLRALLNKTRGIPAP